MPRPAPGRQQDGTTRRDNRRAWSNHQRPSAAQHLRVVAMRRVVAWVRALPESVALSVHPIPHCICACLQSQHVVNATHDRPDTPHHASTRRYAWPSTPYTHRPVIGRSPAGRRVLLMNPREESVRLDSMNSTRLLLSLLLLPRGGGHCWHGRHARMKLGQAGLATWRGSGQDEAGGVGG